MAFSRKRLLRLLAVSAGLGASALGVTVWHYTRPEVQRGLALDALKGAGWSGDIADVSAGLDGTFSAEGISLSDPNGRKLKVNKISGDIGVFAALTGEIHIARLAVDGLVIDGTEARASEEKPGTSSGLERKTSGKTPRIRVDAGDIAGRVALAGGRSLGVDLRVRNLDTLAGGTVVFTVTDSVGPVVTGEARARFAGRLVSGADPVATWRALNPTVSLDAEVRPGPDAPVVARLTLEADSEAAVLSLKSGSGKIGLRAVPGEAGKINFTGDAVLDRPTLATWAKGPLPEFSAKARFSCAFDFATNASDVSASVSGNIGATLSGADGPHEFSFETSFTGASEGPWRIRNLHAEVGAPGPAKAIVADVASVTVYPQERWRVETVASEGASVKFAAANAAWLNPLIACTGWAFDSGEATGTLRLVRDAAGKVSVDSGAGLRIANLAVLRDGKPYLNKLSLTLPVRVERSPEGAFTVTGAHVLVAHEGVTVLAADFSGDSDVTGAGALTVSTKISPGALPADFLPGGACGFCKDAGLDLDATARVSRSDSGATTVESAKVDAVTRDGVRALAMTLARPLNPANIPGDGAPVATLAFKGAPLSLFNPLLRGPLLGGMAESGDLTVAKSASGWKVSSSQDGGPVFVRGLSWTDAGGLARLTPTDVRGSVAWAQTAQGWTLALGKSSFGNAKGAALEGDLAFRLEDGCLASVEADLRGDLPALAESLPDARRANAASGVFSLKARHADKGESTLDLNLTNFRPTGSSAPLGVVMRARASREKDVVKFSSPIVLSGVSGTTRLELDGTLVESGDGKLWNVSLSGDTLFVDDWNPLFVPVSGVSEKPVRAHANLGGAAVKPDDRPFWSGHSGRISVALAAVKISGETISAPRVVLVATPTRLAVESLSGEALGFPASGTGEITFRPGSPKPYVLGAKGGLTGLALGKVIATVAPKAAGWVDGDFDLRCAASGDGADMGMLFSNTTCSVDAESRGGTLRFFKADNDAVRLSGEIAGMAGDLAGDLGKLLGKKNPGVGRLLTGGSVIQKALDVVKYKKLAISVKRLPDGSLEMPAAEVYNEVLRLHASGRLGPAFGAAFLDRNASVSARLDGRDLIAEALRGLGRASEKPDADGWLAGPELRYEGPLNNVRNNLLNNLFRAVSLPSLPVPGAVKTMPDDVMNTLGRTLEGLGR